MNEAEWLASLNTTELRLWQSYQRSERKGAQAMDNCHENFDYLGNPYPTKRMKARRRQYWNRIAIKWIAKSDKHFTRFCNHARQKIIASSLELTT